MKRLIMEWKYVLHRVFRPVYWLSWRHQVHLQVNVLGEIDEILLAHILVFLEKYSAGHVLV